MLELHEKNIHPTLIYKFIQSYHIDLNELQLKFSNIFIVVFQLFFLHCFSIKKIFLKLKQKIYQNKNLSDIAINYYKYFYFLKFFIKNFHQLFSNYYKHQKHYQMYQDKF